jgi:HD superfamily phosphodiesterase
MEQESSANDTTILRELHELVRDTFLLWDEIWVGFSWRHYYFNHTQRVHALCLTIGRQEDADLRKLAYAATLHDITKRYDGKIFTDSQGKRILDDNGFWLNELLMPKRENLVTRLYRTHNQFHKLHNVSGAVIAQKVLEMHGLPCDFCSSIGSIIKSHLRPDVYNNDSSENLLEKKILYEADTIDANLGLTAFYRNIQIRTHRATPQKDEVALHRYVSTIEPWIERKAAFIDLMTTKTGINLARQRLERMKEVHSQIKEELQNNLHNSLEYGLLGVIKGFMDQNTNPNLESELNHLLTERVLRYENMKIGTDPETQTIFQRANKFCQLLSQEITGQA